MEASLEQYWTIDQVAKRLQSSRPSVKRWVGRGELARVKAGSKVLISETAIQDFLRRSTDKAA